MVKAVFGHSLYFSLTTGLSPRNLSSFVEIIVPNVGICEISAISHKTISAKSLTLFINLKFD